MESAMNTSVTPKLEIVNIPVGQISPDPTQPRKHFDIEAIRELADSMKSLGQLCPIIVRKEGHRYILVDGERRFRSALTLCMACLKAIIVEDSISDAEVKEIQISTALFRQDLKPYEIAIGCIAWLNATGRAAKDLAARIGRDASYITKVVSLASCVQPVQEAAAAGRIGISDWYELAKLDQSLQFDLLQARLSGDTRDALAKKARKARTEFDNPKPSRASRSQDGQARAKPVKTRIPLEGGHIVHTADRQPSIAELVAMFTKLAASAGEFADLESWLSTLNDTPLS